MMFSKFFILLLRFVLAVNCMKPNSPEASSSAHLSPEREDEIIKHTFNCFTTMLTNTLGFQAGNIAMSDCIEHMGGTLDHQITNDYFEGHRDRIHEPLNFALFSEIIYYHCNKKPSTVQECADNWKNDWNVQIIKDAFNCFTTMLINTLGLQADNIAMSDCVKFMGGTLDYEIMYDYFNGHRDRILEYINFDLFSEIFYHHCTKKPATVQERADSWKDDWIIVDSFMDCKTNNDRRLGYTHEALSTYGVKCYVALDTNYNPEFSAVQFFIDSDFPLYSSSRDKWIGLMEFNAIFKHFCKVYKGLTVKVCAEQRKEADKTRTERVTERILQDRRTLE